MLIGITSGVTRMEEILEIEIDEETEHSCLDNAVPYENDGALGHGFECGICGKFLQAG